MTIDSHFEHRGESAGMKNLKEAAHRFCEEAYSMGSHVAKEISSGKGAEAVGGAVRQAQAHPREALIAGGTGALLATAVIADSPLIIGAAGCGAVLGGLTLVGEWAQNEVGKLTKQAGL
jgi:hypothetical protein